ncbi:hypothetical protein CBR_g45902 [Chara braunii]|uniref:Retrotransposon gag domain-containing protein n=1 Tax=Chara braunii TaxID=69332 RepID=A0A388LZK0_CHABU|nr:hypothetical protein CBR_g45902 [Chara braunii]|eukprot:GBG87748.1 hypothetical protein CBR_g45902 [Chara braunii]
MDVEGICLTWIGGDVKTQESRTNSSERKMGIETVNDAEKLRRALRELENWAKEIEGRSAKGESWRKEVSTRPRVARFADSGVARFTDLGGRYSWREAPGEPYKRSPYSMAYPSSSYVPTFFGPPVYQLPALTGIETIFTGKNVSEFLDDREVIGMRGEWTDQEMIANFLHHTTPKIDWEVRNAIPDDGRWLMFREKVTRVFACNEISYSIEDMKELKKEEEESLVAFARRYEKASNPLVEGGFMGELEKCGIFLGSFPRERREMIVRELVTMGMTLAQVKALAHDTEGQSAKAHILKVFENLG